MTFSPGNMVRVISTRAVGAVVGVEGNLIKVMIGEGAEFYQEDDIEHLEDPGPQEIDAHVLGVKIASLAVEQKVGLASLAWSWAWALPSASIGPA